MLTSLVEEAGKLPAFFRRDLLVVLSYRTAIYADLTRLLLQLAVFAFIDRMVDPGIVPRYGGREVGYLEFVSIGMAVSTLLRLSLERIVTIFRNEQLTGTLETLVSTPTSLTTIQLGSAFFDLVYIPIRTAVFLLLVAVVFDVNFAIVHLLPAMLVLALLVPAIWGLGVAGAAGVLVFKRGAGASGLVAMIIAVSSGAYFPLDLLPAWAQRSLAWNPVALVLETMREILFGRVGWHAVPQALIPLGATAATCFLVGSWVFRRAVDRELAHGTLGHY